MDVFESVFYGFCLVVSVLLMIFDVLFIIAAMSRK